MSLLPLPVLSCVQLEPRANYAGETFAWLVLSSSLQLDAEVNKEQQDMTKFVIRASPTATREQLQEASELLRQDRATKAERASSSKEKKTTSKKGKQKQGTPKKNAAAETGAAADKGAVGTTLKAAVAEVARVAQDGQLGKEDVDVCVQLVKMSKYTSSTELDAGCVKGGGWDPVAIEIMKPESDPISSQEIYNACRRKCAENLTMPIVRYIKGLWRVKPSVAFGSILKEGIIQDAIARGEGKPEAAVLGEFGFVAWIRAVGHYTWLQQLKADMEPKAAAAADTANSQ